MLIIKGMIIGLGKIIPGVSGSILAISLGVYKRLIYSINNILKLKKEDITFLTKIGIGIIISIVFFSNIIFKLLSTNYLIVMFLFIGLIIGGLDNITKNIKRSDKVFVITSFIIIFIFGIITINNNISIKNIWLNILYFFTLGFIDAITTIIPGISGTATLMMLGGYKSIIFAFSTIFNFDNLIILIPFMIGFIIGCILTAKLVDYLFSKYTSKMHSLIFGFSLGTIFLLFIDCLNYNHKLIDIVIGFILLTLGYLISKKINRLFSID